MHAAAARADAIAYLIEYNKNNSLCPARAELKAIVGEVQVEGVKQM